MADYPSAYFTIHPSDVEHVYSVIEEVDYQETQGQFFHRTEPDGRVLMHGACVESHTPAGWVTIEFESFGEAEGLEARSLELWNDRGVGLRFFGLVDEGGGSSATTIASDGFLGRIQYAVPINPIHGPNTTPRDDSELQFFVAMGNCREMCGGTEFLEQRSFLFNTPFGHQKMSDSALLAAHRELRSSLRGREHSIHELRYGALTRVLSDAEIRRDVYIARDLDITANEVTRSVASIINLAQAQSKKRQLGILDALRDVQPLNDGRRDQPTTHALELLTTLGRQVLSGRRAVYGPDHAEVADLRMAIDHIEEQYGLCPPE